MSGMGLGPSCVPVDGSVVTGLVARGVGVAPGATATAVGVGAVPAVVGVAAGVGVAVPAVVGVAAGVGVAVGAGVAVAAAAQVVRVMRSLIRVTVPFRASARPLTVTPLFIVIEVRARIVPTNVEPDPSVAELVTCQKTLQG